MTNIVLTAYCACMLCCGKTDGITAAGNVVKANHTVACNFLPLNTKILIDGKPYVVEDRMAKRFTNRIDIYFSTHKEALRFGIRTNNNNNNNRKVIP